MSWPGESEVLGLLQHTFLMYKVYTNDPLTFVVIHFLSLGEG